MKPKTAFGFLITGCCLLFFGRGEASPTEGVDGALLKVDLKQGAIQAPRTTLEDGTSYYAFKNIPFAEPPLGKLRFKDPVAAGPWTGTRDGSVAAPACPQIDFATFFSGNISTKGSEDCLYLDVYTPKPDSSKGLPVMVYIHGGGFILGSAQDQIPDHLMSRDVVVVIIQYRLSTLGFMSTEDSVIPGNAGLKDQVLALRWVKDNIEAFGGDPHQVTIFGVSAGAASVHFLMVSPSAEGLFQRAICHSGSALMPNILGDGHREKAGTLGQMLECPGIDPSAYDSEALYDCLQDVPAEKLVLLANAFMTYGMSPQVMVPRVDGEFFPQHPVKLIKKGKYHQVDFIQGINRDEGAFIARPLLPNRATMDNLAENFTTNGPLQLNLDPEDPSEVYAAKRMFFHFIGRFNITEDEADGFSKMMGDYLFSVPMGLSGRMHARDAAYGKKAYLFENNHLGEFKFMDSPAINFGKYWITHGDDLQYLFNSPVLGSISRPIDKFLAQIMSTMWVNFAATGNPTPDMSLGFKWESLNGPNLQVLNLNPSPYMEDYIGDTELEFLTNLPTKHNKMMFPERFRREL